jgi:hypothetical protein
MRAERQLKDSIRSFSLLKRRGIDTVAPSAEKVRPFRFSYFYEIQGLLGSEDVGKEVKVSCTADFRFARSLSTVVQIVSRSMLSY